MSAFGKADASGAGLNTNRKGGRELHFFDPVLLAEPPPPIVIIRQNHIA